MGDLIRLHHCDRCGRPVNPTKPHHKIVFRTPTGTAATYFHTGCYFSRPPTKPAA